MDGRVGRMPLTTAAIKSFLISAQCPPLFLPADFFSWPPRSVTPPMDVLGSVLISAVEGVRAVCDGCVKSSQIDRFSTFGWL